MRHSTLDHMWEDSLDNPEELFIVAKSKHAALITRSNGTSFLLQGDFSGTPAECEAEVRRIMNDE